MYPEKGSRTYVKTYLLKHNEKRISPGGMVMKGEEVPYSKFEVFRTDEDTQSKQSNKNVYTFNSESLLFLLNDLQCRP